RGTSRPPPPPPPLRDVQPEGPEHVLLGGPSVAYRCRANGFHGIFHGFHRGFQDDCVRRAYLRNRRAALLRRHCKTAESLEDIMGQTTSWKRRDILVRAPAAALGVGALIRHGAAPVSAQVIS